MKILLDGKKVSDEMISEIKDEANRLGLKPGLCVILVGDDPASAVYVRNKEKACERAGFYHQTIKLPSITTQEVLLQNIKKVESDCRINGLIVQLPLPPHIDEDAIIDAIPVNKDVDCFHPFNMGKLVTKKRGNTPLMFAPCTPAGVMELMERYNINISGKSVVVVGRSNIVGKPLAIMMLNRDATVTICHSKTKGLDSIVKSADVVVAAVGIPKMISADMIKQGAIVIDVGINRTDEGKLCGDVDYNAVKDKVEAITPVPGGVGPMTIAMLLKNTLSAAKAQKEC